MVATFEMAMGAEQSPETSEQATLSVHREGASRPWEAARRRAVKRCMCWGKLSQCLMLLPVMAWADQ
jgi:hypothetical protein